MSVPEMDWQSSPQPEKEQCWSNAASSAVRESLQISSLLNGIRSSKILWPLRPFVKDWRVEQANGRIEGETTAKILSSIPGNGDSG
jgi:hypothetical protein